MSVRTVCRLLVGALAALAASKAGAVDLTPTETTWLKASAPVIEYARAQGLPLDIVVQPQDTPGLPPMATAWQRGRCTFVLSMRGNGEAQATLDRIEPSLREPVIEAIAAHEMAHCWRHASGGWNRLPAGFEEVPVVVDGDDDEHAAMRREMQLTRREEGFADLVALAWTARHHAARYADVHAWIRRERETAVVEGSHHDTRAWIRLAADRERFAGDRGASVFEGVATTWQAGLLGAQP